MLHLKDGVGNTLPPICGNDCPTGWHIIVDELCQCINDYLPNSFQIKTNLDGSYEKIYPPAVKIEQIKSKFGGLRFYFAGGDDKVRGMVRFAEHLCSKTCELTGVSGRSVKIRNWIWTLCEDEIDKMTQKTLTLSEQLN